MASRPGGHLLAGGHHRVVFVAASCRRRRRSRLQADQLVGLAGHGRDHHRDLVAGLDLALDEARDAPDALEVGHRGAAEFHHQPGHRDRRKASMYAGSESGRSRARARKGALYIAAGWWPRNSSRACGTRTGSRQAHGFADERTAESSIDPAEVERFSRDRRRMVGPARQVRAAAQVQPGAAGFHPRPGAPPFRPRSEARRALEGLRLLDIGCGGGLLSEPMTRLGSG